tara:strand:- start:7 stop:513 length:507 start_codon:yes stop_codon:yes gene_type:complete
MTRKIRGLGTIAKKPNAAREREARGQRHAYGTFHHGESDAPQTVTVADREYVFVDRGEFDALLAIANSVADDGLDTADRAAIAAADAVRADPDEEFIPAEFADRLIDGENPVRVWRDYRGMTAGDLAAAAGISQGYLSEIETGKKPGSVDKVKKIADALGVRIDDLVG